MVVVAEGPSRQLTTPISGPALGPVVSDPPLGPPAPQRPLAHPRQLRRLRRAQQRVRNRVQRRRQLRRSRLECTWAADSENGRSSAARSRHAWGSCSTWSIRRHIPLSANGLCCTGALLMTFGANGIEGPIASPYPAAAHRLPAPGRRVSASGPDPGLRPPPPGVETQPEGTRRPPAAAPRLIAGTMAR